MAEQKNEERIPLEEVKELNKEQLLGKLRMVINMAKHVYLENLIAYEVFFKQYDNETSKNNKDFVADAMRQAKIEYTKNKDTIAVARDLINKITKGELIL